MGALYIGSGERNKKSGIKWKLIFSLFCFLSVSVSLLMLTGPMLVEKWINQKGADKNGYAFSVREVQLSLKKGQISLNDFKVINAKSGAEIIEASELVLNLDWQKILSTQRMNLAFEAAQVDLIISKDLSTELQRIESLHSGANDYSLDMIEGSIAKLNVIQRNETESRKFLEMQNAKINVKAISHLAITKDSSFILTSELSHGGKFSLNGKTMTEGNISWIIEGALSQVPNDIFNTMAGEEIPFSFIESKLNATISAQSENGVVSGEIVPEIRKVNLLQERSGGPANSIARLLTEELTFTLPFTLKNELTLNYQDTYQRLLSYRKYPAAEAKVTKTEKTDSFWPF